MALPESSPTSNVTTVARLSAFEQLEAILSKSWVGRIEQLSSGRFDAVFRIVRTRQFQFVVADLGQSLLMRGRQADGCARMTLVTSTHSKLAFEGRPVSEGQVLFYGRDCETEERKPRGYQKQCFFFDPQLLESAVRALTNSDGITLPLDWALFSPSSEAFIRIRKLANRLLTDATACPYMVTTPEGQQMEQECLRSMVDLITSPHLLPIDLPLSGRSTLVRRANDYLRSRLNEPVGIVDLCQEIGANDRTLRLAFRERYGVGPMTYFRFLRLNAVRFTLNRHPSVSIAEAARAYGFHHLGNFAADYRRLFGSTPSTMKRRK